MVNRIDDYDSPLIRRDKGLPLFACAYFTQRFNARTQQWETTSPVITYCSAPDVAAAKTIIIRANPRAIVKFTAVAPAIGFEVTDNHGEKLRA